MEATAVNAQASRDEFLQLLVTQLRHQDPLEPIKQEDFLSQLAQFSTLEGIETLNNSFEQQLSIQQDLVKMQQFTQSSSLIGKQVTFETETSDANKQGVVEAVVVTHDGLRLRVGGDLISMDQIKSLSASSQESLLPNVTGETAQPTNPAPPSSTDSSSDVDVETDTLATENSSPSFTQSLFPRSLLRSASTTNSLR